MSRGRRQEVAASGADTQSVLREQDPATAWHALIPVAVPAPAETNDPRAALVLRAPHPLLRAVAVPVTRFDEALAEEAQRMYAVMRATGGIGLAAPQVGIAHQLLVAQPGADDDPIVLVNPTCVAASDEHELMDERCLSLPGVTVRVARPRAVVVEALDITGTPQRIEAAGLRARVIQHEMDHLAGVCITDHARRARNGGGAMDGPLRPTPHRGGTFTGMDTSPLHRAGVGR